MELVEWSELRDGQRLIFGRDRRQCRLDAVGEAKGAIVFAYFDVCIGHGSFSSKNRLSGHSDKGGIGRSYRGPSLELRDQSRKSFRLLFRGEVTAGQPLDPEAELAQSFPREVDLPVFKWILVATTHQERELIAVSLIDVAEIEPIALRFVIGHEACRGGEVEQAIVPIHGAMEFAEFGVCYVIALGPHLSHSRHPLKKRERPAHAATSLVGEAAQHRCGVPRMSVPVREEPAIENEDTAYVRPAGGFALFRALKPASQELQNDKRGKVECNQRR